MHVGLWCCKTMYILFIYFQLVLWKDTHSFLSFLFQLLLIVQPLEHVALFSHCHASQCVLVNFWKAHTRASSLTRLVATFLTMNTKITSTLLEKEETFINLYFEPRTLVCRQWKFDKRTFLWSCFCKTFWKNCFTCWEQNLFGSNKTLWINCSCEQS